MRFQTSKAKTINITKIVKIQKKSNIKIQKIHFVVVPQNLLSFQISFKNTVFKIVCLQSKNICLTGEFLFKSILFLHSSFVR